MRLNDSHIALAILASAFFFGGAANAQAPIQQTHPHLAPPKPMLADLSTPYIQQNKIVERVRSSGMDSEAWELIEDPETPNALRAAVIDAAARSQRAKRMPEIYVRRLERFGNSSLTLDSLKTYELFTLGYLVARYDPEDLRPLGGKTEIEKATPLLLLSAASNRHRGDMAIKLVLGMVKANQAVIQPGSALCEPHECIDQALQYYTTEWSVHPVAVCNAVTMVGKHVPVGTNFKSRETCAKVTGNKPDAPRYAEHAVQEQTSPSRFSKPAPTSSSVSGNNLNAHYQALAQQDAMITQVMREFAATKSSMSPLERMMVEQAMRELQMQQRMIRAEMSRLKQNMALQKSAQSPSASSSTVTISPTPTPAPFGPTQPQTPSSAQTGSSVPIQSGSSPTTQDGQTIEFDTGRQGATREFTLQDSEDEDAEDASAEENPKEESLD